MLITFIRKPNREDWTRAYRLALVTAGKEAEKEPSDEWKAKLILSEHSPLRTIPYTILLEGIPYYVAMHLVRHKHGIEWFVRSQRNDRQSDYDRRAARQDSPVDLILDANLQAIINISRRRLCKKADEETRKVWKYVRDAIIKAETAQPVKDALCTMLNPPCVGGKCREFSPCYKEDA